MTNSRLLRSALVALSSAALVFASGQAAIASPSGDTRIEDSFLNPENSQNHSLVFRSADGRELPAVTTYSSPGAVLSGAKRQRIAGTTSNYARVSFSTGVRLNRELLPTRVQFDGESQLCFSLPSSPSSVSLSSKYTAMGIAISGSVSGTGATLSGGPTSKTATTSISKKNPGKKTCINTVDRGISFTGAIAGAREKVVGTVVYKGTKYTLQVGDE